MILANDHGYNGGSEGVVDMLLVLSVMLNLPGRTETARVFHDRLSTENLKQSQNTPIHKTRRDGSLHKTGGLSILILI